MPSPDPAPGNSQDWLARALGKLALARLPFPKGTFRENLCFFTQQAAELAIKAVYQNGTAGDFASSTTSGTCSTASTPRNCRSRLTSTTPTS
jgi:hypothetical protein